MSKPNLRFLLLGTVGVVIAVMAVTVGPTLFVSVDDIKETEQRLRLQNDVRGTLLQALAGTLFLVTAYFGWANLRNAQYQLALTEAGQITERFTRAIDQLGNSANIAIRLGGIYGLARIAQGSAADRPAVAEVLTAYVRTNMSWRTVAASGSTHPSEVPLMQVRAPDIQAVIRVLGDPDAMSWGPRPLEFNDVDLRRAFIDKADFRGAYFEGTHFEGSVLDRTDFTGAHLRGADLRWTSVAGAIFEDAHLTGVRFQDAVSDTTTRWPEGFVPEAHGVQMLPLTASEPVISRVMRLERCG